MGLQLYMCGFFCLNIYNSIIYSIIHLKLKNFPIFLEISGFHPRRIKLQKWIKPIFWYSVLMRIVFQWGRSALAGINGSQNGKGLGYKVGESKLPSRQFGMAARVSILRALLVFYNHLHWVMLPVPHLQTFLAVQKVLRLQSQNHHYSIAWSVAIQWNNNRVTPSLGKPDKYSYRPNT